MLYVTIKLNERPHGSALLTDRDEANERLAAKKIPNFVCSKRMTKCIHSDFMVLCPGAKEFVLFHQNVLLDKTMFLEFILSNGAKDVARDTETGTRRINIGFGQTQTTTNPKQLRMHGPCWRKDKSNEKEEEVPLLDDKKFPTARNIPTLNTTWLDEMKENGGKLMKDYSPLKKQLAQILSFGQACLDSYYPNAFADDYRNNLFGSYLQSRFGEGSFRWEFIDISIQHTNAILPKHMDYKNDPREGYDYCLVYSFTVDQFRICFIMTSRANCGAASERLKHCFCPSQAINVE
jgi:hypothetical protein